MNGPLAREPERERMDGAAEASAYAEADFRDVNAAFVEAAVGMIGLKAPRMLDLGTGPGDIPRRMAACMPEAKIVGLDASAAMLAIACTARSTNVQPHLVQGDAKSLPFENRSFDVVVSNSILHHVADPMSFWKEAARVTRPRGLIMMRDLFRPPSREAAQLLVLKYAGNESELLQEEFFRSLLAAYTAAEVLGQLDAAGLTGLDVRLVSDRHLDVVGRLD